MAGCKIGTISTSVILALLTVGIGFIFRRRRRKNEKATYHNGNGSKE